MSHLGLLDREAERETTGLLVEKLQIKTPSLAQIARNLSGGNQQKVILAKWLYRGTDLFLFDEPTRGIDVGAKYEIYLLLWELAAQGKGVVLVSSDLSELLGVCHRIAVLSAGKLVGVVERVDFDQEEILALSYSEYLKKREQAI